MKKKKSPGLFQWKIDTANLEQVSIRELVKGAPLLDEVVSIALTPGPLRSRAVFIGEVLLIVPFLVLFFPVIYIPRAAGIEIIFAAMGLFLALITVLAVGLVFFGKARVVEIAGIIDRILVPESGLQLKKTIVGLLAPAKQLLLGGLIAAAFVFLAMIQMEQAPLIIEVPVLLGVVYIGLIWGSGLYVVFCIPELGNELSKCQFEIKSLYPYQQSELKQISELSTSITYTGGWFATILITSLVALQYVVTLAFASSLAGLTLFLVFIEIMTLVAALIVVSLPFLGFHSFITNVIKQAKVQRIARLSDGMQALIVQAEAGNADVVERITKIQALIDQVEHSPDSVLKFGMVGKIFSSLLVAIIPIIISSFLK